MPVASNLIRVTRPEAAVAGGVYTAVSGNSLFHSGASTMYAYLYHGGEYVSDVASVVLAPALPVGHDLVKKTITRIHSDSAGLVPDGALAFCYRPSATSWRIAVWDVEDTGAINYLAVTTSSAGGISAPVYSNGWLWYFHVTFPNLTLRRVRCDLTGDSAVSSASITANGPYVADDFVSYMALGGSQAACGHDNSPLDIPIFPRDGSPPNMTPGYGFMHGQAKGLPIPDGRSIGMTIALRRVFALSDHPGGLDYLWPSGWTSLMAVASGGPGLGDANGGISIPPAGSEVAAYPMSVSGTAGISLVRTNLATTYVDADPIPHVVVEPATSTGFQPFAMLARS